MEETRKITESDDDAVSCLPLSDGNDYDVAGFGIEEETVEEVMKRLEEEINGPDFLFPYSSSAFITINGDEESCGPSFSDSASTVMASIDFGGVGILDLVGPSDVYGQRGMEDEDEMWGSGVDDVVESDEEWLARVLSGPSIEFDL